MRAVEEEFDDSYSLLQIHQEVTSCKSREGIRPQKVCLSPIQHGVRLNEIH